MKECDLVEIFVVEGFEDLFQEILEYLEIDYHAVLFGFFPGKKGFHEKIVPM